MSVFGRVRRLLRRQVLDFIKLMATCDASDNHPECQVRAKFATGDCSLKFSVLSLADTICRRTSSSIR